MNINLLNIATQNKKPLLIVAVIATILSTIFSSSFFIKPKYKSSAVVYPTNLYKFSEETPIEQMMQWFESRSLRVMTIKDLNLKKHYNINVDKKNLESYFLIKEFDENVSIQETKYQSAEITVLDTDPVMAYKIVNKILNNFSKIIRKEQLKTLNEELLPIKKELDRTSEELDLVNFKLKDIRQKYNIINYSAQSEQVARGHLGTFDGSGKVNSAEVSNLKSNLEEKGGDYILLEQKFYQLVQSYNYWESEYNKTKSKINRITSYTNFITKPYISYKKVYPIRWVIVVLSILGAVLFAYVYILYQVKLKTKSNFDSIS